MTVNPPSAEVMAIAAKARQFFENEDSDAAMATVEAGLADYDHVRLWRLKARLLVLHGAEAEASLILHRILRVSAEPGFWEIVQADIGHSHALLSNRHKVAYFPVRKCSSTSLHNAMAVLDGRDPKGEDIHEGVAQYKFVDRAYIDAQLEGYFRVLVVRSPLERIRSFYYGNIAAREHLVAETGGKESFYGLTTRPTYDQFLNDFEAYRRTFITARNHTDPLTGYVGTDPNIFDWVGGVDQTGDLIGLLSERSGVALPALNDMRTNTDISAPMSKAEEALMETYEADYAAFGPWF